MSRNDNSHQDMRKQAFCAFHPKQNRQGGKTMREEIKKSEAMNENELNENELENASGGAGETGPTMNPLLFKRNQAEGISFEQK